MRMQTDSSEYWDGMKKSMAQPDLYTERGKCLFSIQLVRTGSRTGRFIECGIFCP